MKLYEKVIQSIEQKKQIRESGGYNGVVFPFSKYHDYIDSIDKGMYYGILGATNSGKSKFCRSMLYSIIDFALNNKYPIKVLYFALEDPAEEIQKLIFIHYLWTRHGIDLNRRYLNSRDTPLPDKYVEVLKRDSKFWEIFSSMVWIINDASSPNEIEFKCKQVHKEHGEKCHIFALIDNYSNLIPDKEDASDWFATRRLSRQIIRLDLCKNLNMTVIGILQQDFETEKASFRNAGKMGISAIEPNMGSVGDVKVICRDFHTIFALFNPWRYEIKQYPHAEGWNIEYLRHRFRSLLMLKNGDGEIAPRLGLLFDGKHEIFEELPSPNEKEALERLYADILKEEREKRERFRPNLLM